MFDFILPNGGILSLEEDSSFGLLLFWAIVIILSLLPGATAETEGQ